MHGGLRAMMGNGLFLFQVLNVSVLEGERVTVEDTGGREPFILANESVLMRGLVLRSWSNQISIRFHSDQQHHNAGVLLLHYQGESPSLRCTDKPRPFPRTGRLLRVVELTDVMAPPSLLTFRLHLSLSHSRWLSDVTNSAKYSFILVNNNLHWPFHRLQLGRIKY